ncbi:MAG: TetR/AcrR family transcriptional regulator [Streptosporangiaceae bacterium]|jgi:AcrR family transcriptional regulator|nr:hypothetical protein [Actinomycetota bacterium]
MERLSRAEQNERNRRLVLEAARSIFLARGYHGASVDEIAEQAGFSKGVVYSRFGNKADLFLALLEQRIDERAEQNAASWPDIILALSSGVQLEQAASPAALPDPLRDRLLARLFAAPVAAVSASQRDHSGGAPRPGRAAAGSQTEGT